MTKTEIIEIIEKKNPKLAKDMENPNFLGWLVLTIYLQNKGEMRELKIVIMEFCDNCYSYIEQSQREIADKIKEFNKNVENGKTGKSLCEIAISIVETYEKLSTFLSNLKKGFNIDDCAGFYGGDFNEE